MIADADLADIAARASTLAERLSGRFVPAKSPNDARLGAERLRIWGNRLSVESPEALAQRLAWEGLSRETVKPLLGAVRLAEGQALPAWTETLRAVVVAVGAPRSTIEESIQDCPKGFAVC